MGCVIAGTRSLQRHRWTSWMRRLLERGLDHAFFAQIVPPKISYDPAVAKYVNVVAVFEFFHFSCVPEESAPGGRFISNQLIHLEFGANINSAHRVVHQQDLRFRPEGPREQGFLLVPTRER